MLGKRLFAKFIFSVIFLASTAMCLAQAPDAFSYQAVVRGADGCPLSEANIALLINIRVSEIDGGISYQEEHFESTDIYGLVQLEIGDGTPTSEGEVNALADVEWGGDSYFIEVQADVDGEGFVSIGAMQLLSVPYALHSTTSDVATSVLNPEDADADPTNELITDLSLVDDELMLTEGGTTSSVNLAELINDQDSDPTNELATGLILEGGVLELQQGDNPLTVDLSSIGTDEDWSIEDNVIYNNSPGVEVGIGTSNPQSTFHTTGSISYATLTVLSNVVQPLNDERIIFADTSLGPVTLQLPSPSDAVGRRYTIRTVGTVPRSFDCLIPGVIDGEAGSITLESFSHESVELICNGLTWYLLSHQTL